MSKESNTMFNDSIQQSSRLTGGGSVVGHPVLRASVLRPSVLGPSRLGSALTNNVTSSNDASDGAAATASGGCSVVGHPVLRASVLRPSVLGPSRLGSALTNISATNNVTSLNDASDGAAATASGGCKGVVCKKSNNPFLKGHKYDDEAEEDDNGNKISEATNNGEHNDEAEEPPDPLSLLRKNVMERYNVFAAAKNSIPLVEKSDFVFGQNVFERVVELNCKMFGFVNNKWEIRRRCSLHLNDSKIEHECSRLIFRTAGRLRFSLNTKVWAGMVVKRLSQKYLLLTVIDSTDKIQILLLVARPVKIGQLHSSLVERINKCKISHPYEF